MDRHKSHAVGALAFNQLKEQFGIQLVRIAIAARRFAKGLIERHIAHRQVDGGDHFTPHPIQIATDGQLHQGVGTGRLRGFGLAHFGGVIDDIRRGADGGIDLGPQPLADADHLRPAHAVIGDDNLSLCHLLTNKFFANLLIVRHLRHLRRHHALTGQFNLG